MYILMCTEFGVVAAVLVLNFIGFSYLEKLYWVAIITGILAAIWGHFSYSKLTDEKEDWEKQIDEIGKK